MWLDVAIKISLNFTKVAKTVSTSAVSKLTQKVSEDLGHFCLKICTVDLSKIAQSGHTDYERPCWALPK